MKLDCDVSNYLSNDQSTIGICNVKDYSLSKCGRLLICYGRYYNSTYEDKPDLKGLTPEIKEVFIITGFKEILKLYEYEER